MVQEIRGASSPFHRKLQNRKGRVIRGLSFRQIKGDQDVVRLRRHPRKPSTPAPPAKSGSAAGSGAGGGSLKPVTKPWLKSIEKAEKRAFVMPLFLSASRNSHLLESVPTAAASNDLTVSTRLPCAGL